MITIEFPHGQELNRHVDSATGKAIGLLKTGTLPPFYAGPILGSSTNTPRIPLTGWHLYFHTTLKDAEVAYSKLLMEFGLVCPSTGLLR